MVKLILKTPVEQIVLAEDASSNLDRALPLGDNVSENDWVRLIGKIDHLKYILPKAIAELTEGQEIAATEYNQIATQFPQIQGYSLDDLLFLYEVYNLDAIVWKSYNCQRITIAFQAQ